MNVREAVSFIKGMFWIRIIPLFVITYFFSLICIFNFAMILASCFGLTSNNNNQIINLVIESKKKLIKITGLQLFLKMKARDYDIKKDSEVKECSICLDSFVFSFSQTDKRKIAELNCSNKHIFHVECLKEWFKTNDKCPLCREPVIN